jgi:hypothetical protein
MQKNIHPIERVVRIVVGIILLSMSFVGPANPWFYFGAIPVLTGLSGWCPLYKVIGVSTCELGHKTKA